MSDTTTYKREVIGEATYNGRKYAVLFIGDTKYGRRAKLAFTDLSKEFWIDRNDMTFEKFPQAVSADDYTGRTTIDDQADSDETEETPSYCTHCGQQIN